MGDAYLWIVVGMLSADFATLREPAGILDATDLALVFCGAEIFLIVIGGILPQRYNHAYECSDNDEGVFYDTAHSASDA
jgi:hypothetical protein